MLEKDKQFVMLPCLSVILLALLVVPLVFPDVLALGSSYTGKSKGARRVSDDSTTYRWFAISPNVRVRFHIFNQNIDFRQIDFVSEKLLKHFTLVVENIDGEPEGISSFPHEYYKYIKVSEKEPVDSIHSTNIKFRVKNSWLYSNHLSVDDILLYRYTGIEWIELDTAFLNSGGAYSYFEARDAGFSYFVIGVKGDVPVFDSGDEATYGIEVSGNEWGASVVNIPLAYKIDTLTLVIQSYLFTL